MRKTPNAVNTTEQGKEGSECEVEKEVGRDEGRDGGMREGGRKRQKGKRR